MKRALLTPETFLVTLRLFWARGIDSVSSGAFGMVYCGMPLEPSQLSPIVCACPQTEWFTDSVGNQWIVRKQGL